MKTLSIIAAAIAVALAGAPAAAATLYSNAVLQGATASPGSVGFTANSSGGTGALSFNIDGFASLDGLNYYEDDFTLTVNGSTILALSYDLGGGGGNEIFTDSAGAVVTGGTFGYFQGGQLQVSIAALPLLAGSNSFTFAYGSPSENALGGKGSYAGPQGTGDEAWGISNVTLTGGVVPEPATWAMMIGGIGMAGGALRRRRTVRTAVRFA